MIFPWLSRGPTCCSTARKSKAEIEFSEPARTMFPTVRALIRRYVLVADWDLQRAFSYRQLIAENGFNAVLTRDGQDAVEILERHGAPVLVLTDLSLPTVDGFSLIERLRELAPADQAAVIAFSAFDEIRAYAHSRRSELGIAQVLSHSIPTASLRRTIQGFLDGVSENTSEEDRKKTDTPDALDRLLGAATAECQSAFGVNGALVYVKAGNREWVRAELAGTNAAAETFHGDGSLFHGLLRDGDTFILP